MPAWLQDMTIDEISLVDDPANEEARVLIVKARGGALLRLREELEGAEQELVEKQRALDPTDAAGAALIQENLMDIQAMQAALTEAETQVTDLTKAKEKAETERDEAIAKAKTAEEALVAANESIAKAKQTPEEAEEAFLKSLPEAAREHFVKQRTELEEMKKGREKAEEEQAVSAEIAKAKAYLKGDDEAKQMGELLHRVRKGRATADDAAVIEGIVKSARAIDAKSGLFQTQGAAGATDADPEAVLKAKAEEIRKGKPELTEAQAYDQAVQANPAVFAEYMKGKRPAIPA